MKIGFFGASVTAQKTGYAQLLSKKLNEEGTETHVFGYGGNHIDDAGICMIDNVIEKKCDYCFIDFFSTSYCLTNERTIENLNTIVYKFTKANCKLIFLFLLMEDHANRLSFYEYLKEYLGKTGLFYIDVNEHFQYSKELCRDAVHTTDLGSEKYSELIYQKFKTHSTSIELPINIIKTRFCEDIKVLSINKIFEDKIILNGNGLIIGFYLVVGPKSGFIKVNGRKYSIWDVHCHYERNHFCLKNINISETLEIKILQDTIDYSKCRREIAETDIKKELNIIKVFYIGENITLV